MISENINLFQGDCMDIMRLYPDGYFDLSIIDPPYGIGEDGAKNHSRGKIAKSKQYTAKNWDNEPPNKEYFKELKRVSKNQIIFGANHFIENIPNANSSCWIVWDKLNGKTDFADCELAYCSFKTAVRKFSHRWQGMLQGDMKNKEFRIHPTQKPTALYDWIYKNYAEKNQKILDTHLGSGSNAISAYYFGVTEFVGIEIDKEYFDAASKRINEQTNQLKLF